MSGLQRLQRRRLPTSDEGCDPEAMEHCEESLSASEEASKHRYMVGSQMVFPVDFRNATSEDFCTSQRAFLPRDRMQIDSFFRKLRNEELERVNKKKGIDTNQVHMSMDCDERAGLDESSSRGSEPTPPPAAEEVVGWFSAPASIPSSVDFVKHSADSSHTTGSSPVVVEFNTESRDTSHTGSSAADLSPNSIAYSSTTQPPLAENKAVTAEDYCPSQRNPGDQTAIYHFFHKIRVDEDARAWRVNKLRREKGYDSGDRPPAGRGPADRTQADWGQAEWSQADRGPADRGRVDKPAEWGSSYSYPVNEAEGHTWMGPADSGKPDRPRGRKGLATGPAAWDSSNSHPHYTDEDYVWTAGGDPVLRSRAEGDRADRGLAGRGLARGGTSNWGSSNSYPAFPREDIQWTNSEYYQGFCR